MLIRPIENYSHDSKTMNVLKKEFINLSYSIPFLKKKLFGPLFNQFHSSAHYKVMV